MEQFAVYGHAIVAMAATALLGLLINPLVGIAKMKSGHQAGGKPENNYEDVTYRVDRAYANLTEVMGLFVAATVAAMIAGANPSWVNWLAVIFFISRVLHFIVHYRGIGKMHQGPRTFIFVVGWACCIVLAVLAIFAVF